MTTHEDARTTERVIRRIAVAVGAVLLLATPALGDSHMESADAYPGDLLEMSPADDGMSRERPWVDPPWDRAVSLGLSLSAKTLSVVWFPVKLGLGVAGAGLGGVVGAATGGDSEAAAGIWNLTTDGSYFVHPADLDRRGDFAFGGDMP